MKRFTGLMIFAFFIAMVAKADAQDAQSVLAPPVVLVSSPYGDAPSNLKGVEYYGYFLSGNYISAIADHSNFTHGYSHEWFGARIQEVADHNMKMMLDITHVFFNGKYLKAGYQTEWNQLVLQLEGHTENVAAFYVVDEPNQVGYSRADVQLVVNIVKTSFPMIPTASILDGESNYNAFVDLFDWVGIDCYDNGSGTCHMFDGRTPRYTSFRAKLDIFRQRIILDPQAGMPRGPADNNSNTYNYGLTREADEYLDVALNDPLVIAVTPFIWQSHDDWYGVEELPVTRNKFTEFGHTIVQRAKERYPAQPSAISPALISVLVTSIFL